MKTMKIYIIEELCWMNGDMIGSAVLTKAYTNRTKAWEAIKALTPADGVVLDQVDAIRGVRVIEYNTEEVTNYGIQEIEVEL